MAARMRPNSVASGPENAEKRSARSNGPDVNPGDPSAVQAGLPEEQEIRRQQMAALIRQTPVTSTVSMANSLVTALTFWSVASHPTLVVWLCVVWALALIHLSRPALADPSKGAGKERFASKSAKRPDYTHSRQRRKRQPDPASRPPRRPKSLKRRAFRSAGPLCRFSVLNRLDS